MLKINKNRLLILFTGISKAVIFAVRAKGLEPPRRKAPDPKSGTSTNSATPAKCGANVCDLFYTNNRAINSF